ncbi:hypothetical protein BMS3Abin10_01419 [bacterium BMS3Abin10]|nr:hypothetical protein BMS3Abin10_01419 [bacterium BMS3Abin10]GBE39544.1 hypothetical protein BMS3Bbin08_02170 [bacterium BMS3Bbin08]
MLKFVTFFVATPIESKRAKEITNDQKREVADGLCIKDINMLFIGITFL